MARCRDCERARYHAKPFVEPATDGSKVCTDCKTKRPVTDYPRHRREKDGRHQICKVCHNRREKERRAKWKTDDLDRSRRVGRAGEIRRRYGLSVTEYDAMLERQGGGCAVCGRTADDEGRHLAVDHDAALGCCGKKRGCAACIRGLLCGECNTGLGKFGHDVARLLAAAAYLSR